ncbi:MAG: phosphopantothenoylcysteine decarboxylase [Rhizomicrobium sp.]
MTTAREMLAACESALPADVAVMTAAVADWRPEIAANNKIKKEAGAAAPTLRLVENPDILATLARHAQRPHLLIGFAAETENVVAHAVAKRARKGCDWIVANDVSPATGIMGGDRNTVHLITATGTEDWPDLAKSEVGVRLAARIAQTLKGAGVSASPIPLSSPVHGGGGSPAKRARRRGGTVARRRIDTSPPPPRARRARGALPR